MPHQMDGVTDMDGDIRSVARLGLVHHMLYPLCTEDGEDHARTLLEFVKRDDIETMDCCLPYGNALRAPLIPAVRDCGMVDITFATHLYPLRKLGFTATAANERGFARLVVADMVEQAVAIGATGFIFASGEPAPGDASDAHYAAFREFCGWVCGELAPHGITALLEPFDTDVDKKFLYGSTRACVDLIESLQPEVENFGIELDVAHLPLMREEFGEAILTVAPYLKRVHLGNCVLRDSKHPRYGDTHPPIGYPPGEIDTPQVAEILRALLDVGYLDEGKRGNLVIEMTPWPGRTVEETIADNMARLNEAWHMV